MSDLRAVIKQQSRETPSDGNGGYASLFRNRGGQLEVNSIQGMYDSWLRAGKVFEAHKNAVGALATIEANATYDVTEPFFRLTVPSTKVMIPIQVKITPSVVWTTADGIMLQTSGTGTWNTGGTAALVRNMAHVSSLDSEIGSTAMTDVYDGDSALTESTLVAPIRVIDFATFVTGGLNLSYEYNILKGDPWTMIHGPSSFMVHAVGATNEVYYTIKWAELDKTELVNT